MYLYVIALIGILFPYAKIPIFLLFVKYYPFPTVYYNTQYISDRVQYIITLMCTRFFWWHLVTLLLTRKTTIPDWFTIPLILYNLIMYQMILLSQWKQTPFTGVFIVMCFQYIDSVPPLYSLVDSLTSIYYHPMFFLPQKLFLYFLYILYKYGHVYIFYKYGHVYIF
jgi:hypothetical protein